jgi:SAM-dependent methyltransferase
MIFSIIDSILGRNLRIIKTLNKISPFRAVQYDFLKKTDFEGNLLDFGGGDDALYRHYISGSSEGFSYQSINIDPVIKPTWLVGVGEELPCKDENFDCVLSLNTLEHVFEAEMVINQLYRILKKDGKLVLSTPFMFRIHGHPDDYFRPTPSWFQTVLSSAGFKDIKITRLWIGPFTSGECASRQPGPAKVLRMRYAVIKDTLYHYIRCILRKENLAINQASPLGLWVVARK